MKCPICGLFNPNNATSCDCGFKFQGNGTRIIIQAYNQRVTVEKKKTAKLIIMIITCATLSLLTLLFFFSFHIVLFPENITIMSKNNLFFGNITIIPKEHLSLAETFVDVDKVIETYNESSIAEKLTRSGVNNYLMRRLKEKDIIRLKKEDKSGTRQEVTLAMYDKIHIGMEVREALNIIGKPGKELARSEVAGIATIMLMWQNDDGSGMNIMFQNWKVIQKAQYGLK